MTLAQLYAGDGATTGYNGSYAVDAGATARLNIRTTFEDGQLLIEIWSVALINGAWVRQNGDLSIYWVTADGLIRTKADCTLDAAGNLLEFVEYHGDCLLADAGVTDVTGWKAHVTTSGDWEWHQSGNQTPGKGSYYFVVTSEFDAAMQSGQTFQQYADGDGTMETVTTVFANGICTRYAQQQTAPGEPGPVYQYQRIGARV